MRPAYSGGKALYGDLTEWVFGLPGNVWTASASAYVKSTSHFIMKPHDLHRQAIIQFLERS